MTRSGYRRAAALLVASAATVLTAACGGGSTNTATAAGNGQNTAFAAYADCLKQNGVTITLPSGAPGRRGDMPWPSNGPRRSWSSDAPGASRPSDAPGGSRPSDAPNSANGAPRPSGGPGFRNGGGFPGGRPGAFGGKPEGVDDATWQKAQEACSSLRPSGRPGGRNSTRNDGRNAAYLNCLKDNGVTNPSNLDPADATVKKALETCKVLRPSASPSPSA